MFVGNIYKELSLTVVLVLVVLFNFIRQYIGSIYRIIIMYILYTCCMLALLPVYISHLSDTERAILHIQYTVFSIRLFTCKYTTYVYIILFLKPPPHHHPRLHLQQ